MIVKRGGDRGRLLILLNVFLFPFLLSVSLSLLFPSFFISFAFLPCPLSSSLFSVFPFHFHPSLALTLLLPHALNLPFFLVLSFSPFLHPLTHSPSSPSPSPLFVALSFPLSTPSHSSLSSPSHPLVPFPLLSLSSSSFLSHSSPSPLPLPSPILSPSFTNNPTLKPFAFCELYLPSSIPLLFSFFFFFFCSLRKLVHKATFSSRRLVSTIMLISLFKIYPSIAY